MSETVFNSGDVVVHPKRPEWGNGTVMSASVILHEGVKVQRLVIKFSNKGRVVINTGVAGLVHKDQNLNRKDVMSTVINRGSGNGWLKDLENEVSAQKHELWALPEGLQDPFLSLEGRLKNTAESFKFSKEARSLMDWAVVQTGLDDPLSKYNRHELEEGFMHFERDRNLHLLDLVKQLKSKMQVPAITKVMDEVKWPKAKVAIAKAMKG